MDCDCLEKMSEALVPYNVGIDCPLRIDMKTGEMIESLPHLVTFKLDSKKRGRLPLLLVKFCPFCGAKCEKNDGE